MTGFWKGKRLREWAVPDGLPRYAVLASVGLLATATGWAQEEAAPPTLESLSESIGGVQTNANILWTLVAAALVFWMQAGFALSRQASPAPRTRATS